MARSRSASYEASCAARTWRRAASFWSCSARPGSLEAERDSGWKKGSLARCGERERTSLGEWSGDDGFESTLAGRSSPLLYPGLPCPVAVAQREQSRGSRVVSFRQAASRPQPRGAGGASGMSEERRTVDRVGGVGVHAGRRERVGHRAVVLCRERRQRLGWQPSGGGGRGRAKGASRGVRTAGVPCETVAEKTVEGLSSSKGSRRLGGRRQEGKRERAQSPSTRPRGRELFFAAPLPASLARIAQVGRSS